jgi:hypothetical protein
MVFLESSNPPTEPEGAGWALTKVKKPATATALRQTVIFFIENHLR